MGISTMPAREVHFALEEYYYEWVMRKSRMTHS